MACRADDIEKYKNDITVLQDATKYAQKVVDCGIQVDSDLTDLQGYYSKTIEASDEFINEFHVLDRDGLSNARMIKLQIEGALRTAKELLKAAEEEEESCEIHHPSDN